MLATAGAAPPRQSGPGQTGPPAATAPRAQRESVLGAQVPGNHTGAGMCLMSLLLPGGQGLAQEHSVLCLPQIHTHSRPGTHRRSQKCQLFAKGALDNPNLRSSGLQGRKPWGRTLGTRHKKWAALLSSLTPAGRGSPTDRRLHVPDRTGQRPAALCRGREANQCCATEI